MFRVTPLYIVWHSMKQRCLNTNASAYNRYGGKGIQIFSDWLTFANFEKWALANGFRYGLTLERKDNSGDYSPENCCWATYKTQANNRTSNVFITAFGESKTLKQWSEDPKCEVSYATLHYRIRKVNIQPELAMTMQLCKYKMKGLQP